MPIRFMLDIDVSVSSDCRGLKDLGNNASSITSDAYNEGGSQRTLIPAASTDKVIPLDDIANVGVLYLKVQPVDANDPGQVIGIRLNDVANDLISIFPMSGKKVGYFLLTSDAVTSLFVTNAGTVDVALTMIIAGD